MTKQSCLAFLAFALLGPISVDAFAEGGVPAKVRINSHKDALFSLKDRKVLEARDGGSFKRYPFDETQDVNGRDAKPGAVAKPERLDMSVTKDQRDFILNYPGGELDAIEVGKAKDAKFAVIFIHGGGGTKAIGANDVSFGGNFNRLKNLAQKNDGVYYSPTVVDDQGIAALIKHIKLNSPNAKVVIACGSAGAGTCWSMADDPETLPQLGGLVFLGGTSGHQDIANSALSQAKLPIVFSHGTKDPIVDWKIYEQDYAALKKMSATYPVRLELFEGGKHGTPLRLHDWKDTLDWMLGQASSAPAGSQSSSQPSVQKKTGK